ncbi:MAG: TetR/AcrR family transcriptional regulator [Bacteroidia bacterium]|jgi:AcrR family transcriptional regulator|nr:TetR/AcrR family transcriptional regulator [Bacteroidia bacterium]
MSNKNFSRKEQILESAAMLFKQNGYASSSMRDLASLLGIEAASLYHHVKSKEEILENICFALADKLITSIAEVNDIYFNAEEKLRSAIKNHIEIITDNSNFSAVFIHEWRHLSEPKLGEFKTLRLAYENEFKVIIQEGIREDIFDGVDEKFATLTILSTLNWVIEWFNKDGEMTPEEISTKLSDFILGGLRKKLVTDLDYKP